MVGITRIPSSYGKYQAEKLAKIYEILDKKIKTAETLKGAHKTNINIQCYSLLLLRSTNLKEFLHSLFYC